MQIKFYIQYSRHKSGISNTGSAENVPISKKQQKLQMYVEQVTNHRYLACVEM